MVKCSDGTYYTGWTTDVDKRTQTHNRGKGAKYTRSKLPVELVYYEWHDTRSLAQKREAIVRKLSRKRKEELIKTFNEGKNIRKNKDKGV